MTSETSNEDENRKLVHRLAESGLREQRASRRWNVFFRILLFGYIFGLSAVFLLDSPDSIPYSVPHAAVVEINGVIAAGGENDSREINTALRAAFENESSMGVILKINSPGGSPVESNRIYRELRRLREKYPDKKSYAVAGDYCASGGYYAAAGTDEIYVDENSIVGSIGVIVSGFGFVDALEKLGVERRVYTAGDNKNTLDPFLPALTKDERKLKRLLSEVHDNFVAAVREGRGERLSHGNELFSGAIFSGRESVMLGLADGVGDAGYVAREVIGVEEIVFYNGESDILDKVIDRIGTKVLTFVEPVLR